MKLPVASILLLFPFCSFGQVWSVDSLLVSQVETTIDSVKSFYSAQWKIDSLNVLSWSSALKNKVLDKFATDSLNVFLKLDSLSRMNKDVVQSRLDSIIQKKESLLNEVRSKQDELLERSRGQLNEWHAKVKQKFDINKVPGVEGISPANSSLSDLISKIPDNQIANSGLSYVNVPDLNIPQIPAFDIGALESKNLSADLTSLNESLSLEELNGFGNIQDRMSGIAGNLSAVSENPSQVLEQSLTRIEEVSTVTDQFRRAEAFSNNEPMQNVEMLKDPEVIKEKVKKEAIRVAMNHFAGKEQLLQQALGELEKYKKKYESLNNLEDVKELPKNSMRGKPFAERFVPGIAFQVQRNDDLHLDINPYAGYRITGKFTAGAGWNQRIGYSLNKDRFTSASVIYGPRLFAEMKIWKSFSTRFETEWMNTTISNTIYIGTADPDRRDWAFTPLMGIKKEQRLFKSVKGTILLMFNLYNPLHKSPYGDLIYSRIGFEFSLKKTKN